MHCPVLERAAYIADQWERYAQQVLRVRAFTMLCQYSSAVGLAGVSHLDI